MRRTALALGLALLPAVPALAQDTMITLPAGNFGRYDPTRSAKEAVLANWEMAASGLQAGEVLSGKIVELADQGASFAYLQSQAAFAQRTILSRYQGTAWVREAAPTVAALDAAILQDMVTATAATCDAEDCVRQISDLRSAYVAATEALENATEQAASEIEARQGRVDATLLSEQLSLMADYLEGGTWIKSLPLSDQGLDGATIANRIVGTVTLWRNIEPYVGLKDPEVDNAINEASQTLLRTLRSETRQMNRLDPAGPIAADLTAAANALAAELRRASALFPA